MHIVTPIILALATLSTSVVVHQSEDNVPALHEIYGWVPLGFFALNDVPKSAEVVHLGEQKVVEDPLPNDDEVGDAHAAAMDKRSAEPQDDRPKGPPPNNPNGCCGCTNGCICYSAITPPYRVSPQCKRFLERVDARALLKAKEFE